MNSRGKLVCYPRRSFYPLIDGPPTWDRRVTRARFRVCSRCPSRSQAPLCPCTQGRISIPAEGTFALSRYFFGRSRPRKTARLAVSPARVDGAGLELQEIQGGISPAPPSPPERGLLRLPPILRRVSRSSAPDCSKAARGLSVLPRVGGIFTPTTFSPGTPLRQSGSG